MSARLGILAATVVAQAEVDARCGEGRVQLEQPCQRLDGLTVVPFGNQRRSTIEARMSIVWRDSENPSRAFEDEIVIAAGEGKVHALAKEALVAGIYL